MMTLNSASGKMKDTAGSQYQGTDESNIYPLTSSQKGATGAMSRTFIPQELRQNLSITTPPTKRKRGRPKLGEKPVANTPLKALRLGRGITLEELAERAQISPSYLSRLEGGSRRLNAEVITRLSLALSCKPGDLFVGPLTTEGLLAPHPELLEMYGNLAESVSKETGSTIAVQNLPRDLPVYGPKAYTLPHLIPGKAYVDNQMTDVEYLGVAAEKIGRFAELVGVTNAYGLYVKDKTMEPRYQSGDVLLVNPEKPLIPNCFAVVALHDPILKKSSLVVARFLGWTPHVLMIEQYSVGEDIAFFGQVVEPSTPEIAERGYEIHLKRSHVVAVHRIIGCTENA